MDLARILENPPKLHLDPRRGQLISDWYIDNETSQELDRRLQPDMKTIETGAGLSTLIFAAHGCDHTCIMPHEALANRVKDYCLQSGISMRRVNFVIAKSRAVLPSLSPSTFDLALIDGCHGFPSVFVDFCYLSSALKIGGTLFLDDMHIYTCHLTALFMQSDQGWNVQKMTHRFVVGIKLLDTIDADYGAQPFVVIRSGPPGIKSAFKFAARSLLAHGPRAAVRNILTRLTIGVL